MEKSSTRTDDLHSLLVESLISGPENYTKYYTPKDGDIIIDAGAHVGYFTRMYSRMVGNLGLIIAIEPDYRALGLLTLNTEDCSNIKILPYALWDEDTIIEFHTFQHSLGVSSCVVGYKDGDTYPVRAKRLDTIINDFSLSKIDFIKMDIEASELHALKGMSETLKSTNALAIAAYHRVDAFDTSPNAEKTFPEVEKILRDAGFIVRTEQGNDGEVVYANRN